MAEMTPTELTATTIDVAVSALENASLQLRYPNAEQCVSRDAWIEATKKVNATHVECLHAIGMLRELAAQPPAVDRERRLREALEAAEKYIPEMTVRAVAVTGSDKPEYEESPHPVKAMVRAALADQPPPDPREAALEKAEKCIGLLGWSVNYAPLVEDTLAAIRAARGKA